MHLGILEERKKLYIFLLYLRIHNSFLLNRVMRYARASMVLMQIKMNVCMEAWDIFISLSA